MIPYHGLPMTPREVARRVLPNRHAFPSFSTPDQIDIAAALCRSIGIDNGAYPFWRTGKPTDWPAYYRWCEQWLFHPVCDFAVIPDVIDGDEKANDDLLAEWPFRGRGVPVWHMHESIVRLERLCDSFERVALGSSGEFAMVGSPRWWVRMAEAMNAICDNGGRPRAKLHGLRMLNPEIFTKLPLSSADSTNVARNVGIDSAWVRAPYAPASKETRGQIIAERIELHQAAARWEPQLVQQELAA